MKLIHYRIPSKWDQLQGINLSLEGFNDELNTVVALRPYINLYDICYPMFMG